MVTVRREPLRINPKLCARFIMISVAVVYAVILLNIYHHQLGNVAKIATATHSSELQSRNVNLLDDYSMADSIAKKWNITTPHAAFLLSKQYTRHNDYDVSNDFLHFHHIAKTGGTSISDILKTAFGETVMPGSERSGSFSPKKFHAAILENAQDRKNVTDFSQFKVSFGHTRLRPMHGPNRTELSIFFDNYNSLLSKPKRIRSLAMVREPTDLRASSHAMAMCALNGKVNTFNYWREKRNQTRVCTKEEGLDVEKLVQDYHDMVLNKKCPNSNAIGYDEAIKKLDRFEKNICTKGAESMSYCLSPSHLLSSPVYDGMRSMYKSLLGRYIARQPMMTNYVSIEKLMRRMNGSFDVKSIEEYALVDLGGLDLVYYDEYDMDNVLEDKFSNDTTNSEPDILWFGITERMVESTCLLFHMLNVKPFTVPRSRVVNCPPTSWWTTKHREEVKKREPGDYAVWRVANAILDVRIERMKKEIHSRLNDKFLHEDEKERLQAFIEAGCVGSMDSM